MSFWNSSNFYELALVLGAPAVTPPSITISLPVMYEDSSEAKNKAP
jgi:hypothetical protein